MGVVQVLKNPTPAEVNAHRVVYLVPPTGHQTEWLAWCGAHVGAAGLAVLLASWGRG